MAASKYNVLADREEWPCLIWEAARLSGWVEKVLPNYGSDADVAEKSRVFAGAATPKALQCLHQMLLGVAIFHRSVEPLLHATFPSPPPKPRSVLEMRTKVAALNRLDQLELPEAVRQRASDTGHFLTSEDAKNFVEELTNATCDEVDPPLKINSVLSKYAGAANIRSYTSPFPQKEWLQLEQLDRTVMCNVLQHPGFLPAIRNWQDMLDARSASAGGQSIVDFYRSFPFLDPARLPEESTCYEIPLANRLTEITTQLLMSESLEDILRERSSPRADEGFWAAAFRFNWKQSDEQLIEAFKRWLGERPTRFARYRKGSWSETRGPEGLELPDTKGRGPITPRRALNCLEILSKFKFRSPSDLSWKEFVANQLGKLPSLDESSFASQVSYLSEQRILAERALEQLFPLSFFSQDESQSSS